jgi:hypothetical protein
MPWPLYATSAALKLTLSHELPYGIDRDVPDKGPIQERALLIRPARWAEAELK